MPDVLCGGRIDVGVLANGKDLPNLHVMEIEALLRQRRQQCRRLAHTRRHDDEVTIAHLSHGFCRGSPLLKVELLE